MSNTMEGFNFKVLLSFIFVVAFFGVRGEGCTNDLSSRSAAVRLSNDLLCDYNKNVRPVVNQSTQTNVNMTFYIFNVFMDDQWEVVTIGFQLIMSWKDEYLTWDPSKYDNIKHVHEYSPLIWIPDIMSYYSGFRGSDANDFSYFLPASMVKINSDGIINYNHRVTLNAQCSTNIAKWPFDSHNCSFLIGSPIYTNNYVNYSFPQESSFLSFYIPDREWMVNGIHKECLHLFYSKSNFTHCLLQFTINIERFSSMYFSSIIIPAVVISLMRTFTFLMGRETLLRITLLCLFFISELWYLQYLDVKIPNNGENSVFIVLLYRNCLILTAVALIISVISNELYKRSTEDFPRNGPEWAKNVIKFLLNKKPISLLTNFNTQGAELLIENNVEEDTPNSQRDEKALFWKTVSILLDRLSFLITLILSFINFLFLIP